MTTQTTPAKKPVALHASTVCEAFQMTAAERPAQVAHRTVGGGVEITFAQFASRVRAVAGGLHRLGVGRGDTVALMLVNRPEFNLVDTAAIHLGATPFSVYNTLSAEQINYLFRNACNRVVITEPQFLERVLAARTPDVTHIILVEGTHPDAMTLADLERLDAPGFDFDAAWTAVQPDDVVTLIYTSGTTGPPKAVQLTHANVLFECRALGEAIPFTPGGRMISYLPSAHVGDRVSVHYSSSIFYGMTVTSLPDYRRIGEALVDVRPTVFGGVPRVWEKLKAGLEAAGIRRPRWLPGFVKRAIQRRIGLDQASVLITSAAPTAPDVLRYFSDLGLPLNEGWGMSELSCFATLNPPDDNRTGTVGKALPGVSLRLLDDGELLVKAPLVMKGYRGDPVRTAEALDEDGWLHSGDIATIDEDGYVRIVDRKKELIINAAGKNMSPANIEQKLRSASPLIAQAVCIGDRRPYNVALIALDVEAAARWATHRGLTGAPLLTLAVHEELHAEIHAAIAAANETLSRVEQVKRFAVLRSEWLPGGDELTPTMKLKRKPIHEKYSAEIERLYRE